MEFDFYGYQEIRGNCLRCIEIACCRFRSAKFISFARPAEQSARARDAKGDVKLETREPVRCRQGREARERGERRGNKRIDVTFVNLSEERCRSERAGGKSEKRKVEHVFAIRLNRVARITVARPCAFHCTLRHFSTLALFILAKRRRTHDNRARKIYYENWDPRGARGIPLSDRLVSSASVIKHFRLTHNVLSMGNRRIKMNSCTIRHVRQIFQYYFYLNIKIFQILFFNITCL